MWTPSVSTQVWVELRRPIRHRRRDEARTRLAQQRHQRVREARSSRASPLSLLNLSRIARRARSKARDPSQPLWSIADAAHPRLLRRQDHMVRRRSRKPFGLRRDPAEDPGLFPRVPVGVSPDRSSRIPRSEGSPLTAWTSPSPWYRQRLRGGWPRHPGPPRREQARIDAGYRRHRSALFEADWRSPEAP